MSTTVSYTTILEPVTQLHQLTQNCDMNTTTITGVSAQCFTCKNSAADCNCVCATCDFGVNYCICTATEVLDAYCVWCGCDPCCCDAEYQEYMSSKDVCIDCGELYNVCVCYGTVCNICKNSHADHKCPQEMTCEEEEDE